MDKNNLSAEAGMVLKSLEAAVFEHYLRLNFSTTNNETEYEAFVEGLRSSSKLLVVELHIFMDSKLVVNQVTEKFKARGAQIAKYLAMEKTPLTKF